MTMRKRLENPALQPLPIGSIRPTGWLRRQLEIQRDGLSGALDQFWPDIAESSWFGGDKEGWERGPYWLDGVIPLAWLLEDGDLQDRLRKKVEHIIEHQAEDGWLGPREANVVNPEATEQYDWWGQILALKVLSVYHDATGDEACLAAMTKLVRLFSTALDETPLFNWGRFRWFEALIGLFYLYDRTGEEQFLDVAGKFADQGFDWRKLLADYPFTEPTPKGKWDFANHVVNNAMAIKAYGLLWRMTGDEEDRETVGRMIDALDRYHGQATGIITGDECLAGRSPSQGTELCAVAEYLYSLETLLSTLGKPAFGDRLERIAYNALPATFSPDMWSHQYDQQANQVECSVKEGRVWTTNGPDANIFGLEPHFGCCASNLSQAWPKLAAHLWMKNPDGGLTAVAYGPSFVQSEVEGVGVEVRLETEYPFRDVLTFRVKVDHPVRLPLDLRIPEWCEAPELSVAGAAEAPRPGGFHRIEREWSGETEVVLRLPMRVKMSLRYKGAVSLERGPLVYSLKIGEEWKRINEEKPFRELPHGDFEVYPTTPWNYGLELSEENLESLRFEERPIGDRPFSPEGAPVSVKVSGRRLPMWKMKNGSALDPPESPVKSDEMLEDLTLIPYGCTNLRVTEFPRLG